MKYQEAVDRECKQFYASRRGYGRRGIVVIYRTEAAHEFLVDIVAVPELRLMIIEALHARDVAELDRIVRLGADAGAGAAVPDHADYGPVADQMITEMAFCRMVDSFHAYLFDILSLIAHRYPRVLGLGEGADVFDEVDKLSRRGGVWRLIELLSDLDAAVFSDQSQNERVKHYVDVRNLLVHHRGRIHRRFAERCGLDPAVVGEVYHLSGNVVRQASADLLAVATAVDVAAVTKFGVESARVE